MKQEYFVVVLAHSLRGRLRRIHVPHTAVYAILALALVGCFSAFGFVASYARMAWKVANYNALKRETDGLRTRYQSLQKVASQTNQQLASLQLYAKEVSLAYGIKQKLEGPSDISAEGKLVPTFAESVRDYDFLKAGNALAVRGKAGRLLRASFAVLRSRRTGSAPWRYRGGGRKFRARHLAAPALRSPSGRRPGESLPVPGAGPGLRSAAFDERAVLADRLSRG